MNEAQYRTMYERLHERHGIMHSEGWTGCRACEEIQVFLRMERQLAKEQAKVNEIITLKAENKKLRRQVRYYQRKRNK